ncbi:MAG: flagellar biosynthetic protein FliR [Proteobacteria bacterium]|nr:flagellar biosynthetic protein FliR [Pseudomonadota bacterium]
MLEDTVQAYLSLTILLVLRFGAALRLTPFFGGAPLGLLSWFVLSVVLACVLVPQGGPLPSVEIGTGAWLVLAAKEIFIGVVLGTIVRIAFSVFEVAGDLARLGTVSIPDAGDDSFARGTPISRVYTLLAAAVFLLVGGHHAVLSALGSTVRCLPPGMVPSYDMLPFDGSVVLGLFGATMAMGVLVSAPVFVAGISADILTGLISRFTFGDGPFRGMHAVRAVCVQVVVVIALGTVVATALGFLQDGVEKIAICSQKAP